MTRAASSAVVFPHASEVAFYEKLVCCAKTVSELHLLERQGLLFERKQIPQIVVNVRT
jgi:hypothetical protein